MTRERASEDAKGAQIIRHRCPEGLILALMKRMVDDLLVVRASTLVANGDIRRDAVTALIQFEDDGVEHRVGVRIMRFPGGGLWARFVCPRCGGGSQPACEVRGTSARVALPRAARSAGVKCSTFGAGVDGGFGLVDELFDG